jgi:hypothetical protein
MTALKQPTLNGAITQGEAQARTDARSVHAVLELSWVTFFLSRERK